MSSASGSEARSSAGRTKAFPSASQPVALFPTSSPHCSEVPAKVGTGARRCGGSAPAQASCAPRSRAWTRAQPPSDSTGLLSRISRRAARSRVSSRESSRSSCAVRSAGGSDDPVPLLQGVQRDAESCSRRRQQRRGVASVRNLQGREHRGDAQREGGRGQRAPIREPGRSQPEAGPAERRREDRAKIEGSALARRVRADTARLYLKGARGRLRIRWRSAYGAAVARSRGAACATWSQSSARTRAAGSPR